MMRRCAMLTGILLLVVTVAPLSAQVVPLGSPTKLTPLPATPLPPAPQAISVEQYVYLSAQYSYLTSLISQLIEGKDRQDQGHSAILSRLTEIENRLSREVDEKGVGDLSRGIEIGASVGGLLLGGLQAWRNPKCQP